MPTICVICDHDSAYHLLHVGSDDDGATHTWGKCLKPGCTCTQFIDSYIEADTNLVPPDQTPTNNTKVDQWARDRRLPDGWPRDKYDLADDWRRVMQGYKPSIFHAYKGELAIGDYAVMPFLIPAVIAVIVLGAILILWGAQ